MEERATFSWEGPDAEGIVKLSGTLNAFSAPNPFLTKKRLKAAPKTLIFDLSGIEHLDLNGAAFLLSHVASLKKKGTLAKLQNLKAPLEPIWELAQKSFPTPETLCPQPGPGPIEKLGELTVHFFQDMVELVSFFGEV
jgi:anti-anti-sigma regulatory factor